MNQRRGPLILALDTSTACCTLALTGGTVMQGEVLASISLNSRVKHSRRLLTAIDWMLAEAQTDWSMLDGIAVGLGPGSFTGLRIGLATAKGLATAADKPLLGVSTLDSLASNCTSEKVICAVIDARKKQVYTAYYKKKRSGLAERTSEIRSLDPAVLLEEIQQPTVMIGDGIFTYGELWRDGLGAMVDFAPVNLYYPSAAHIGLLSGLELENGRILDIASAVPLYVRGSDADLNLARKNRQKLEAGT